MKARVGECVFKGVVVVVDRVKGCVESEGVNRKGEYIEFSV